MNVEHLLRQMRDRATGELRARREAMVADCEQAIPLRELPSSTRATVRKLMAARANVARLEEQIAALNLEVPRRDSGDEDLMPVTRPYKVRENLKRDVRKAVDTLIDAVDKAYHTAQRELLRATGRPQKVGVVDRFEAALAVIVQHQARTGTSRSARP